jgi:tetratricopeptide (TPR) repeat protein
MKPCPAAEVLLVLISAIVQSAAPARAQAAHNSSVSVQNAQRQFDAGNYSGAISTLQPSVQQNSADALAHYWVGRSYYELRDFDQAVSHLEKATQLDPPSSLYHQWLGRAYGGKADREHSFTVARKVKKEFEEAVKLNSSNIAARRDLEEFCIDAPWIVGGSKDEARQQVDAIAAIDPVEGHLARATFYLGTLKKPDLADNEYHLILDARPNRIEPYLEAADFYRKQNKPADLETFIDAASKASPSDSRLAFYRGVQRVLSSRDQSRAEEYLKSYLASTHERSDWPSHAAAREWLGRLYEAEGKRAEAAEQYRAALQIDPGRKEARTRLERLEKAAR